MRNIVFILLLQLPVMVLSQSFKKDMDAVLSRLNSTETFKMNFDVFLQLDSTKLTKQLISNGSLIKSESKLYLTTQQQEVLEVDTKKVTVNHKTKSIAYQTTEKKTAFSSVFQIDTTTILDSILLLTSGNAQLRGYRVFLQSIDYNHYDVWIDIQKQQLSKIDFYYNNSDESIQSNGYLLEIKYSYNDKLSPTEFSSLDLKNYIEIKKDGVLPSSKLQGYTIR